MREIDPGHKYALRQLDSQKEQVLTFVKREGEKYPGNIGHYPGTNLQEVLRAMIARLYYLDNQQPAKENHLVIYYLRNSIRALELRAARQHGRETPVEVFEPDVEVRPYCPKCGHIGCLEH
jgi:hypothetical protein